ncbi:Rha family regulatory protein [Vibrio phage 1.182.O._10N.286.46.E1]|nr:Rha family regulatory protein [Vibrio phage 1.182.O._10N.286.46.E1]
MNELISSNQPLTMSSREIAGLTGKRHDHVLRDIQKMIDNPKLGFRVSDSFYSPEGQSRTYKQYLLPRRSSDLLVMSYSVEIQAKVYDRWQELESSQAPRIPQTLSEALQLAADQAKALELAAPKVAFVDNFVEVGTTKTLRETAKILKYPERKMIALLVEDKVLYRQSGNLLPYQNRHEQGLFDVKTGERNGHAYTQTRVTTKGVEWLAGRYASELMLDE